MLNEKSTELVAIGASITANCQPCLEYHVAKGREFGADRREFLEAIEVPVLLMQGNPRQVLTANKRALDLFGKDLRQVEGHRGGQVFDCLHSFSAAGCGMDVNCENCAIKGAIVDTFATGVPHDAVAATLPVRKAGASEYRAFQVSTERIGDLALVRIERYDDTDALAHAST